MRSPACDTVMVITSCSTLFISPLKKHRLPTVTGRQLDPQISRLIPAYCLGAVVCACVCVGACLHICGCGCVWVCACMLECVCGCMRAWMWLDACECVCLHVQYAGMCVRACMNACV